MSIATIFHDASRIMTVISFATFMGIVIWTYAMHKENSFANAARLPFADEEDMEDDYV